MLLAGNVSINAGSFRFGIEMGIVHGYFLIEPLAVQS